MSVLYTILLSIGGVIAAAVASFFLGRSKANSKLRGQLAAQKARTDDLLHARVAVSRGTRSERAERANRRRRSRKKGKPRSR